MRLRAFRHRIRVPAAESFTDLPLPVSAIGLFAPWWSARLKAKHSTGMHCACWASEKLRRSRNWEEKGWSGDLTLYLLDSNVFIQAKNHHYGFDIVPAFWDWLAKENRAGHVASIEQVESEILAGGDELSEWAKARGETFFLRTDLTLVPALNKVGDWAASQGYDSAAVAAFLRVADHWLVAYALEHKCVVVTHEISAHTSQKDQNSERVSGPRYPVRQSIRDAAGATGQVRA